MKRFVISAAAVLSLALPSVAAAQDTGFAPATEVEMSLAREIVDNGFPPETRINAFSGVVEQLLDQMIASNPSLGADPRIRAAVDRFATRVRNTSIDVLEGHLDALMEGMIVAYAESFDEAELRALHAYVTSPEGRGFLTRVTAINAHPAFADANQAYMNDYMTRVPALQEEFVRDLTAAMSTAAGK